MSDGIKIHIHESLKNELKSFFELRGFKLSSLENAQYYVHNKCLNPRKKWLRYSNDSYELKNEDVIPDLIFTKEIFSDTLYSKALVDYLKGDSYINSIMSDETKISQSFCFKVYASDNIGLYVDSLCQMLAQNNMDELQVRVIINQIVNFFGPLRENRLVSFPLYFEVLLKAGKCYIHTLCHSKLVTKDKFFKHIGSIKKDRQRLNRIMEQSSLFSLNFHEQEEQISLYLSQAIDSGVIAVFEQSKEPLDLKIDPETKFTYDEEYDIEQIKLKSVTHDSLEDVDTLSEELIEEAISQICGQTGEEDLRQLISSCDESELQFISKVKPSIINNDKDYIISKLKESLSEQISKSPFANIKSSKDLQGQEDLVVRSLSKLMNQDESKNKEMHLSSAIFEKHAQRMALKNKQDNEVLLEEIQKKINDSEETSSLNDDQMKRIAELITSEMSLKAQLQKTSRDLSLSQKKLEIEDRIKKDLLDKHAKELRSYDKKMEKIEDDISLMLDNSSKNDRAERLSEEVSSMRSQAVGLKAKNYELKEELKKSNQSVKKSEVTLDRLAKKTERFYEEQQLKAMKKFELEKTKDKRKVKLLEQEVQKLQAEIMKRSLGTAQKESVRPKASAMERKLDENLRRTKTELKKVKADLITQKKSAHKLKQENITMKKELEKLRKRKKAA